MPSPGRGREFGFRRAGRLRRSIRNVLRAREARGRRGRLATGRVRDIIRGRDRGGVIR